MIKSNKKKIFTEYPRTRTRLVLFSLFVLMGFALISTKIAFLASKKNQTNERYSESEKIPSRLVAKIYPFLSEIFNLEVIFSLSEKRLFV